MYAGSIRAQVTQEWVANYNGSGTGSFYAVKNAIDKFGNLIVLGRTSSDYITLKYNNSGNLLWEKRYNGIANSSDMPRDMTLDDSGNVYVTGYSFEGTSNGGVNWLTIKYNTSGNMIWVKSLDWIGHKGDDARSIKVDNNYNVYVTGYGYVGPPPLTFKEDLVVAKYNKDGELQWTRSHSSHPFYSDHGHSILIDSKNFIYVSGYAVDSILTIKYDQSGNTIWERTFFRNTTDMIQPLFTKLDQQNNIIVNGYYSVETQYNFVTLKYDDNGNLLWSRIFDSPVGAAEFVGGIEVDVNSNIFITGSTFTTFYHDVMLLKYSPLGDTLWIKTYDAGYVSDEMSYSIVVDTFGNAYVTGSSYSTTTLEDFITLKYDSFGNLLWEDRYIPNSTPPGQDLSKSISIDKNNNVFISGSAELRPVGYAITSIKYSQLTEISVNNNTQVESYKIMNYPNPFNPTTKIKYELPMSVHVLINIFNIIGEKIQCIVDERLVAGVYEVEFNGASFASGIYFYSFYIDGKLRISKKLILLK